MCVHFHQKYVLIRLRGFLSFRVCQEDLQDDDDQAVVLHGTQQGDSYDEVCGHGQAIRTTGSGAIVYRFKRNRTHIPQRT